MRRSHIVEWIDTVAYIAAGVALVAILRYWVGLQSQALLVTGLLLPPIVALAITGRLSELSAGSVGAKFRVAASTPVALAVQSAAEAAVAVAKGTKSELDRFLEHYDRESDAYIALTLKEGEGYRPDMFEEYLTKLAPLSSKLFVVVEDDQAKVIAYLPSALSAKSVEAALFGAVTNKKRKDLRNLAGVRQPDFKSSDSLTAAVRDMTRKNLSHAIVVDTTGKLMGVLDLGHATTRLVIALTE
jgi:hypothetical protein